VQISLFSLIEGRHLLRIRAERVKQLYRKVAFSLKLGCMDVVRGVGFEPTNPYYTTLTRYLNYLLSNKTLKLATIKRKVKTMKSMLFKHNVDLSSPESFVAFLNTVDWASGTKDIAVNSYRDYLNMLGLKDVRLPHIRREEKLPFIPLEEEIDTLISAMRAKTATFLRLLKDTAVRPIEAWRLKWLDIDVPTKSVTITPAKYSKPRKLKIKEQTLNMILALRRRNSHVFSPSGNKYRFSEELEHFARNFVKIRKRVANRLKNPRLNMISLRTFRHWKATAEYYRTRDVLHIKELLGHRNISNTLKYVHLADVISQKQDEWVCKVAKTIEEATRLIENGFEYVTAFDAVMLYRKRK